MPKACPYVWAKSFFGTHSSEDGRRWGNKKPSAWEAEGWDMIVIESVYFITLAEEVVPSV